MDSSTVSAGEREEWQALVDADTLHMLPAEAHIASVKHLAQRLLDLDLGDECIAVPASLMHDLYSVLNTLGRSPMRLDEDFPDAEWRRAYEAVGELLFPMDEPEEDLGLVGIQRDWADLYERLQRAEQELTDRGHSPSIRNNADEVRRLIIKAQGIKLAIDYMRSYGHHEGVG